MNILKRILYRISHFLLTIVRVLRKAICCRRRKDESLLPLTVNQADAQLYMQKPLDSYQYHSQWEAWPQNENKSAPTTNLKTEVKSESNNFSQEESPDDFFKEMVPQIRKPKKIYIRKENDDREDYIPSNRLAMDPSAILSEPDLGVIDDSPSSTWEDTENLENDWDPNKMIRETKRIEREKRLAEHQRRKQERESRKASKQNSSNSIAILNLSDSKDKTKSS